MSSKNSRSGLKSNANSSRKMSAALDKRLPVAREVVRVLDTLSNYKTALDYTREVASYGECGTSAAEIREKVSAAEGYFNGAISSERARLVSTIREFDKVDREVVKAGGESLYTAPDARLSDEYPDAFDRAEIRRLVAALPGEHVDGE